MKRAPRHASRASRGIPAFMDVAHRRTGAADEYPRHDLSGRPFDSHTRSRCASSTARSSGNRGNIRPSEFLLCPGSSRIQPFRSRRAWRCSSSSRAGITRIAVTPPSTICRRSTTKGATTQRSQPQALRRPLNRDNSSSGLYFLVGIPARLQAVLSHSRWYKNPRSGQIPCPRPAPPGAWTTDGASRESAAPAYGVSFSQSSANG
jgi:hypothetical protein